MDTKDIERDRDLQQGLVADQCKMIDRLQDGLDRAMHSESRMLSEIYLYRLALTDVLRNVPTEDLGERLPDGAPYCLQRRNGKVIPVKYTDRTIKP